MPYKLSDRELVKILQAIYEKYYYIADALQVSSPFPVVTLDQWKRIGAVSREVTSELFVYYNKKGERTPYNQFVFGRLYNAIVKGGSTFEELFETAVYSQLSKENAFAMRVAEMNTKDYLVAFGGHDLVSDYYVILEMLLAYHRGNLHPLVLQTGKLDTRNYVNNYRQLASEFYHRIGTSFDWQVIAHFLVYETKNQGEGTRILAKYGNVQVYRSVLDTACEVCKALYVENSKPKIFRINDLLYNGTATIYQRIEESATIPTCGPSHLWCNCGDPSVLTGLEWWLEK